MDQSIFVRPPKLDPAVWRPEVPLIVMERCLDPPADSNGRYPKPGQLIAVWLSLRWLMAAFPKRSGFGTRLIARRAGVDRENVTRYAEALVELGLVEVVGEEQVGNFPKKRPIYSLPLQELDRISNEMALETLLKWEDEGPTAASEPENQLSLDLPLPDAEERSDHGGIFRHGHGGTSGQGDGGRFRHEAAEDSAMGMAEDPAIGMDGSIDRMDGRGAAGEKRPSRPRRSERPPGRPPHVPPAPPAELVAAHQGWTPGGPLPKHPRDLWRAACPSARRVDDAQLAALAAEHDAPTGGYGWYWVGRAILAVSLERDARSVAIVRNTLIRWREEDSYGSDRTRPAHQKEIGSERPPRSAPRPVAPPRRDSGGPPAGLKLAGRRNGTPPAPDGGEPA